MRIIARLLKEKEDLESQLEALKAVPMPQEDQVTVNLNLKGIEVSQAKHTGSYLYSFQYPPYWAWQNADFQTFGIIQMYFPPNPSLKMSRKALKSGNMWSLISTKEWQV